MKTFVNLQKHVFQNLFVQNMYKNLIRECHECLEQTLLRQNEKKSFCQNTRKIFIKKGSWARTWRLWRNDEWALEKLKYLTAYYTHSVYPENPVSWRANLKTSSLCPFRFTPRCTVLSRKDSGGKNISLFQGWKEKPVLFSFSCQTKAETISVMFSEFWNAANPFPMKKKTRIPLHSIMKTAKNYDYKVLLLCFSQFWNTANTFRMKKKTRILLHSFYQNAKNSDYIISCWHIHSKVVSR